MKRSELKNLDIVSNIEGVWLYVSNMFYPLHEVKGTDERRGRKSIPLASANKLTTLLDSGDVWLTSALEEIKKKYVPVAPEVHRPYDGPTHTLAI